MKTIPILLGLLLILASEYTTRSTEDSPEVYINADDLRITKSNGYLFWEGVKFSGYVLSKSEMSLIDTQTPYVDGRMHGTSIGHYPDGRLAFERPYDMGQKAGIHRGWYADGTLKFEYAFEQGVFHGAGKEWFEDGSPYRAFTYVQGKEEGVQKMWYEDGSLRANYVVKNGRRYGLMGSKPCS